MVSGGLGPPIRPGHTAATTHVGFVAGCPDCPTNRVVVREVGAEMTTMRVFAAYVDGLVAGVLSVDGEHDEVALVYVRDDLRRQGVATRLLAEARRLSGLALEHDQGDRSLQGSAWCRANGIKVGRDGYRRLGQRDANGYGARLFFRVPLYDPDQASVAR